MLDSVCCYLVAAGVVKLGALAYLCERWTRRQVATVQSLMFFPVKSCRGFPVQQLHCGTSGLVHGDVRDRQFLVVDSGGRRVTGTTHPRMFLIQTHITPEGHLTLDAPDMDTFLLQLPITSANPYANKVRIDVRDVSGVDCGDAVSSWLSTFLLTPGLRLLSHTQPDAHNLHYQDESALSLLSVQSVNDVSANANKAAKRLSFRSNIIVDTDQPYAEDNWTNVFIGDIWLQMMFHTERCVMTTIDEETGEFDSNREPLKTLRTYRVLPGHEKPCLAISMAVKACGIVRVGDPVLATQH